MIANADCHVKNIGRLFLVDDGRIRLAPLYDTVPTALWPELRSTAALTVNDVSPMRSITVDDIAAEARRWSLPFDAADTEATGLLEALLDQVQHADHDEVAALVATNTRRLLDQTARHVDRAADLGPAHCPAYCGEDASQERRSHSRRRHLDRRLSEWR